MFNKLVKEYFVEAPNILSNGAGKEAQSIKKKQINVLFIIDYLMCGLIL